MRPKKYTHCLNCFEIFHKRRSTTIYCSRNCQMIHLRKNKKIPDRMRKGEILECLFCKKPFYVPQYRIKRGNAQFCSRSCLAKTQLPKYAEFRFKPTGKPKHKYKSININGKQIRDRRVEKQSSL